MEELFVTHGADAPSGENLEYDPVFTAMELAAQPGEERQAGEEIIRTEGPKPAEVAEKAMDVLARSHDLRAGVLLAGAQLAISGYPGFAEALRYLRFCLEEHWATCHPQLDAEDDDDPTMRVNAVGGLAGDETLRALRRAPLTQSRNFGLISLRDLAILDGEVTPGEDDEVRDAASVSAAFKDTDPELLAAIHAGVENAIGHLAAIDAKFDSEIPAQGPDLAPLNRLLKKALARLGEELGTPEGAEGDAAAAPLANGADPQPGARPAAGPPGAITSQADVRAALDRILAYYAKQEPSSPLPILLERAKRLVGADFVTVIKDVAPDGLANVQLVGGLAAEEEGY